VRPGPFCDMFRPRMRTRLALLLLLPLLACASSRTTLSGEVKYGASAEEDYEAGVDELKHSNWNEAQKFLEHVRTKYPFSKYAPLAELRLADAKFKQDKLVEAGDAYAAFVQLHPTHDEADYAEFQSALCYAKDAPSDFALFPASYEKDQKSVARAAEKLKAFLKSRPASPHKAEAEALLFEAEDRLVAREWYVAEFYMRRERWAGAAGRYEGLLRDYPSAPRAPDAMLQLARAYLGMQEGFRAQQTLQKLLASYPTHPRRPESEALLAGLRK
jgi:outer membrane protein assembly factor BamD